MEAFLPYRDLDDALQLMQCERQRHQHAPPHYRADPDQPDPICGTVSASGGGALPPDAENCFGCRFIP